MVEKIAYIPTVDVITTEFSPKNNTVICFFSSKIIT